ncbi:MAG: dihydropteroate synthase [Thermoanaerobaculia bacterium]
MPSTITTRAIRVIPCSGGRAIVLAGRPLVMGVLNLTPDSFSDGGLWLEPEKAVERGLEMVSSGADLLDLGAESTRPGGGVYGGGAAHVPVEEEMRRLLPVLERLRDEVEVPISVDTRKGEVASAALASGADLVNDISALGDPELARVVVETGCPVVLMHSRGELAQMQREIGFDDLLAEVVGELGSAVERAVRAGVSRQQIFVDPGIGFGKTPRQNLLLLRNLDRLHDLGCPVLVGASRKSFIGHLTGAPADDRLGGSLAAVGWAAAHHAAVVRVHDVAATRQFLDVWEAIDRADEGRE